MSQFTADTGTTFDVEPAEELVQNVTSAVADAEGVDQCDLEPLYGAVDPDALDSLLRSQRHHGEDSSIQVTFAYHGYDVTVGADAAVDISKQ